MRVSAPNGNGFGTSKSTPSAETAETLLRGGFGNGFGTSTTTDGTLDTLNRSLSGQQLGDALDHVLGKPEGNSAVEMALVAE